MTGWFKFRVACWTIAFLEGLVLPSLQKHFPPSEELPLSEIVIINAIGLVALPAMMVVFFWLRAMAPLGNEYWKSPTHHDNPFHFRNPFGFFHFVAFCCPFMGLGLMIAAIWTRVDFLVYGVFGILYGVSLLAGVHLSMRVFKDKMQPSPEVPE